MSTRDIEELGENPPPYPGSCAVYQPEIDGLLPVYVYDDYPGWRVKTFLYLSDGEFENYVTKNVAVVRTVTEHSGATGVVKNHSTPGPSIIREALSGSDVPLESIVCGSCLQYVARRSDKYTKSARDDLSEATRSSPFPPIAPAPSLTTSRSLPRGPSLFTEAWTTTLPSRRPGYARDRVARRWPRPRS